MTLRSHLVTLSLAALAALVGVSSGLAADYTPSPQARIVVAPVPTAGPSYCYGRPLPLCGGGGSGCWNVRVNHGESHWHGWWNHAFQASWCSFNGVIASSSPTYHGQGSNGTYGPNGLARPYVGSGCIGCNHIRWDAQAHFTFTAWWPPRYTSHFDDWIRITLYPSGTVA